MATRTMKFGISKLNPSLMKWFFVIGLVGAGAILAVVFRAQWLSAVSRLSSSTPMTANEDAGHDEHAGHDHGHEGHDEATSLELSPQARKNAGLQTTAITLGPYVRTVTMPAMVIGRPGRAQIEVTAPLGGRVTRVYPIEGEAVEPGQPLFDLRLTHEELVRVQSEFLQSVEELDVELQEIERLESIVESGAIAGKRLLERQYEKQKLEAVLHAKRQSLLLHGLSQQQVNDIQEKRTLVQGVTVYTPEHPKNGYVTTALHPFTVRALNVKPGQYIEAGTPLCLLQDYAELYIEGRAFEQDADELLKAARAGWEVSASRDNNNQQSEVVEGLKIVYVDNEVEPESRALHFYVSLPNESVYSATSPDGHRFLTWRHKPGQRMQLYVPVEQWLDRIVLPIDAVAIEGVEYYVFQQNGNHFDRVPVQVEYQDQFSTVIANDGSLFPGDVVAISGAHQLQMALKNKAGGGVDPHAGHNH